MKTYIYLLYFSLLFTATACRDNSPKPQPVTSASQLPSYSETGANTFGCLIDGEVFLPGKPAFSSYTTLQCEYQYVNGKWSLSLNGTNFVYNTNVSMNAENTDIHEGAYNIKSAFLDNIYARTSDFSGDMIIFYTNSSISSGELNIKYFDSVNQIISGTFWFDAVDTATGKIKHITEGRFDTHFYK